MENIGKYFRYIKLLIGTLRLIVDKKDFLLYKYFGKGHAIFTLKNGLILHVNEPISLWVLGEVFVSQDYKPDLKSAKIILDIGAHIGISTLYFNILFPQVKIFSYEPSSVNFKYLNRNIKINKLENIKPFRIAVSNVHDRKLKLLKSINSMTLSTVKANAKTDCMYEYVNATNIKNIIRSNHIKKVDIVKIDCEGEEYNILLNLDRTTFNKIESFIIEYHNHPQYNYSHIIEVLKKNRYFTYLNKSPFFNNTGVIHAYKKSGGV